MMDFTTLSIIPNGHKIFRSYCEFLALEAKLKDIGLVKIEDVKEFSTTTVWGYREILEFAITYGFLPEK